MEGSSSSPSTTRVPCDPCNPDSVPASSNAMSNWLSGSRSGSVEALRKKRKKNQGKNSVSTGRKKDLTNRGKGKQFPLQFLLQSSNLVSTLSLFNPGSLNLFLHSPSSNYELGTSNAVSLLPPFRAFPIYLRLPGSSNPVHAWSELLT